MVGITLMEILWVIAISRSLETRVNNIYILGIVKTMKKIIQLTRSSDYPGEYITTSTMLRSQAWRVSFVQ